MGRHSHRLHVALVSVPPLCVGPTAAIAFTALLSPSPRLLQPSGLLRCAGPAAAFTASRPSPPRPPSSRRHPARSSHHLHVALWSVPLRCAGPATTTSFAALLSPSPRPRQPSASLCPWAGSAALRGGRAAAAASFTALLLPSPCPPQVCPDKHRQHSESRGVPLALSFNHALRQPPWSASHRFRAWSAVLHWTRRRRRLAVARPATAIVFTSPLGRHRPAPASSESTPSPRSLETHLHLPSFPGQI